MECISLHCGQTGIQWGLSCWELMASEHKLTAEGKLECGSGDAEFNAGLDDFHPFYQSPEDGTFKPRALYIDCDDNVLQDETYGSKLQAIDDERKILGSESCCNIFGQGLGEKGQLIMDRSSQGIRKLLEECESPQGFVWFRSLGGGTGSGFASSLLKDVRQNNPKLKMQEFSLLPGDGMTFSKTDPYNTILGLQSSVEYSNFGFLIDSDMVYRACFNDLNINNPTHYVVNSVLARVVSDVTSTLRFPTIVNGTMADMEYNLLPIKSLQFPMVCVQPLLPYKTDIPDWDFENVLRACFDKKHQLLPCDPATEKIIRSCLVIRGEIRMNEVTKGLNALRSFNDLRFITSFMKSHTTCLLPSSLSADPSNVVTVPKTQVCSLTNSLAITDVFEELTKKFDMMFSQKAFLHWYYSEGMEESDFINAREDIETLIVTYKGVK